ncbi:hypothetical protein ACH5RR_000682 [Cinchona calisaya]|uniref:Uncharacterized protein n=1 Tax=Cinchona calisaya TaxID=153742 RepID=A0ABD3B1J5_9GENT
MRNCQTSVFSADALAILKSLVISVEALAILKNPINNGQKVLQIMMNHNLEVGRRLIMAKLKGLIKRLFLFFEQEEWISNSFLNAHQEDGNLATEEVRRKKMDGTLTPTTVGVIEATPSCSTFKPPNVPVIPSQIAALHPDQESDLEFGKPKWLAPDEVTINCTYMGNMKKARKLGSSEEATESHAVNSVSTRVKELKRSSRKPKILPLSMRKQCNEITNQMQVDEIQQKRKFSMEDLRQW